MKLSLESYHLLLKFEAFEAFKLIKQAGFDCVDMSYYWQEETSPLLDDKYQEYAVLLRSYLDKLGLTCNQAHAPFAIVYGEEFNLSNKHYLDITRAIESASILGAKTIVVHSIILKKDSQIYFDRAYNLAFYKSLQPLCEKFNIKIAIENLFVFDDKRKRYQGRLGTATELCEFISELNSPYFVACVDVGHAAMTGNEPEQFLAQMDGNLLAALHIQDGNYREDCHTVPYLGDFDWTKIMKTLKQIEYKGELTFEIIKYLRNIPKELLFDALCFAEKIGRHLISIYNE
jgi:sugar phosphate isomerase/epimerase